MLERIKRLLENPIILHIAKSISVVVGVMFTAFAVGDMICALFSLQWWAWILLSLFCGLVAGACFGIYFYLDDEY